jgi:hypothetical protein
MRSCVVHSIADVDRPANAGLHPCMSDPLVTTRKRCTPRRLTIDLRREQPLKLIRLHAHLILWDERVRYAETEAPLSTGVNRQKYIPARELIEPT